MSWAVILGLVSLAAEPGGVAVDGTPTASSVAVVERLPAVAPEPAAWPAGDSLQPAAQPALQPAAHRSAGVAVSSAGESLTGTAAEPAPESPLGSGSLLGAAAAEEKPLPTEPHWFRPAWLKPWKGSFEIGLDGSSGNSETLNLRLGFDGKRKTELQILSFDLDYHKNTNNSLETAHRLFFDWRYELPFPQSPWSWFAQGTTIYDEFQPWDVRVSVTTGVGLHFIKSEARSLVGRFGGGFSQDIGGPDQRYVPELNYGLDYEHQINKRHKIKASVEYYPDVTAFGDFRVVSKADWEVLLDEEMNLSLKLSATDHYKRPNPGGKLNDIDYSMVLLWKF